MDLDSLAIYFLRLLDQSLNSEYTLRRREFGNQFWRCGAIHTRKQRVTQIRDPYRKESIRHCRNISSQVGQLELITVARLAIIQPVDGGAAWNDGRA